MSSGKAGLKAINDAIRQQKFDDAIEKSQAFLKAEPKNYQCHIFLAFALDKKGHLEESEKVYASATQIRPQDPQAWQGLVKLFEKQGPEKFSPYQNVIVNLARVFHDADDMYKSQDVVIKYIDHVRVHGDALQYADALWVQLPESPLYPILEGRFPQPAQTYESIARILEDFERKKVNNLIGERRTRIGAKLSEVTLEVKREVYAQSRLEHIYRQLINWTSDDEVRRVYEEKLLQYCYERLVASPAGSAKTQEQKKVYGLAHDMVVIKHPYRLAWDIAVDWEDAETIKDTDVEVLRNYCSFFPESDLYKVITAFLTSKLSPFPQKAPESAGLVAEDESEDSDDDEGGVATSVIPMSEEDRLMMLTDGISTADSLLAYRLAGSYLLEYGEYEATVECTRKAITHLERIRSDTGTSLTNTESDYLVSLGTALVYYQSPRHHAEAKGLFDKVLAQNDTSTPALIGVGLIYEEEEEYDQAIDFFSRALKRDPTNLRVRSEAAWVQAIKGNLSHAKREFEECVQNLEKSKTPDKELLADCQYRLGYCLWNLDTSKQARRQKKGESAYAYWLSALNTNINHAPTYTSLGIFYQDYAKDRKRSRRCFQKALELSASEVDAAERLARLFADDGDWDRVELVAQRVVDSGKVKPPPGSKRKGISWPFAALGVADLNKQDFHKSIVSFQAALRISPNNYHCWIGLGESYYSSGRYVAATKAIANAQRLEEAGEHDAQVDDTWFTKYMLANIKRELGEYDEAIELYQAVLKTHHDEQGVIIALMQTMTDNAWAGVEKGLFGKSVQLAIDTIEFASKLSGAILQTFNFWKSLADACSVFSMVQNRIEDFPTGMMKEMLESKGSTEAFSLLSKVDMVHGTSSLSNGVAPPGGNQSPNSMSCLHAVISCQKLAIHASSNDLHAQAVAYYNLGWAEYRAHTCLGQEGQAQTGYVKAAIRAFKRAIELEAGNSDFWNALGVVVSNVNPSVAQHAFVRSLYLNERSPLAWVNLGALALFSGDLKLANEVFTRAQSTDPDYAQAWVGQGFVALLSGETKEARGLFTHAMEISTATSIAARRHYSSTVFDYILTLTFDPKVASLIQPLFALHQVRCLQPDDLASSHLAALYSERTKETTLAVDVLEKVCQNLEAEYERTESSESMGKFTLARTDLARAYLSARSYEKAAECGEMALGLSSEDADSGLDREQRNKARLSAHLTLGLAHYFLSKVEDAIQYFDSALEEANHNPDAVCLLAQVLWAHGSTESRERARTSLFEVIEKHPSHVQSVLLLGVIALFDDDQDSLEAVVEELNGLRTNAQVTTSEKSQITNVLRAVAVFGSGSSDGSGVDAVKHQAQNDIMLSPHLPHVWSSLAQATGDNHAAEMALTVAARGIPPRGDLEAPDLCSAYAGTGRVADAQRAAVVAPWEKDGWSALRQVSEGM